MEGLSLALLDAMGAGLCVLTSDVPENREVVDGAGFTFQRGARRPGGPAALPDRESGGARSGWESGEEADRRAVSVAEDRRRHREGAYFQMMGWTAADMATKKPAARA